jgi:hypothetical protein
MIIGLPVLAISLQKFFIKKLSYHISESVQKNEEVDCVIPDNHRDNMPNENEAHVGSGVPSASSPISVSQVPPDPILNNHSSLFMVNEEYKESILHYDVDGDPDTELLIKMWDDVCIEENENFYRFAFNQYYASHPHLHGFYDKNGYELEIVQSYNIFYNVCQECNRTHHGKYGLENTVFRDYLELSNYDPRYDVIPYMPRLDTNGLPVLRYPSRPMFPRFYIGENIEWEHMHGRDEDVLPSLTHVSLMLLINIHVL